MQESQPLCSDLRAEKIDAGRIATRPRQARNKTKLDRIVAYTEHDRDRTARGFCSSHSRGFPLRAGRSRGRRFLSFRSANESADSEVGFRQGLSEIGYNDGRNGHIAFRWAEGQKDRLPVLASDLVNNLDVAVIAATGGAFSALAAKAATKTIPIVFTYAADPVRAGIVASLNRPEENITGVTWFGAD